jgi:predicted dienelactone hydrolase
MYPVHDDDAALLLSLTVAAKRRPAALDEIITALAMAQQGEIPAKSKLVDAFARMGVYGLIAEAEGGYTLSAEAQAMMTGQRAKDDSATRLVRLKQQLANFEPKDKHPSIQVTQEQLLAAIQSYKAAQHSPQGKNIQTDKPKSKSSWIPTKDLVQGKQHLPPKRRRV